MLRVWGQDLGSSFRGLGVWGVGDVEVCGGAFGIIFGCNLGFTQRLGFRQRFGLTRPKPRTAATVTTPKPLKPETPNPETLELNAKQAGLQFVGPPSLSLVDVRANW